MISEITNGLPQPVIIVNNEPAIKGINTRAIELLEIENEATTDLRLGQLLSCNNAVNVGVCNTTFFCSECNFSKIVSQVLESKKSYRDQVGTIHASNLPGQGWWRVKFDASFIDIDTGLVMLTIQSIISCESDKEKVISPYSANHEANGTGKGLTPAHLTSEALLNNLFIHATSGLLFINENGVIEKWNQKFLDLTGLKKSSDTTSTTITSYLQKAGVEMGFAKLNDSASINQEPARKIALTTLNGEKRVVQAHFYPCYNANRQFVGIIFRMDDSTENELLKETLDLHKLALENSPSAFYYINSNGEIIHANQKACDLTGIEFNTSPLKNITDINPLASAGWWNKQITILETNPFVETETLHTNPSGKHYLVVAHIFRPDAMQPNLYSYYCHNITENAELKESLLRESRVNLSMAEVSNELTKYHHNPTPVELLIRQYALEITESPFGFISYIDPLTENTKYSIYSDFPGNVENNVKIIEAWFREWASNSIANGVATDMIVNDAGKLLIDGKTISDLLPFNNFAANGIYYNSNYVGLIFVAGNEKAYPPDTTTHLQSLANLFAVGINRVKQNRLLSDSLEHLELAMNVASISIWDIYPERNEAIITNHSCQSNQTGTKKEKYNFTELATLVPIAEYKKIESLIQEHVNSNSSYFRHEFKTMMINGKTGWIEITGRVIDKSADGKPKRITGIATDICNRVQLTHDLLKSKDEAEAANKAKSNFLAKISHEFRTPLNAIIGFADLLKNSSSGNLQESYLDGIKSSGKSLLELVTDILDYSKMEAGKLALKNSQVDLHAIIMELKGLFEPMVMQKNLDFKVSFEDGFPKLLLLDESKIRQIITNLLSNAIKFTETGSVTIECLATPKTPEIVDISFKIIDTGIGIKPSSQETIFDDFVQQDDIDSRKYGGTGLGLAIVKKLVSLMEGKIELESYPGKGTKFTIHLYNCKVTEDSNYKTSTNRENKEVTSSPGTEISHECKTAVTSELQANWQKFRLRPSFTKVPDISLQIKQLASRFKDSRLLGLANRMENSMNSFNVEELESVLREFEKYCGLNIN